MQMRRFPAHILTLALVALTAARLAPGSTLQWDNYNAGDPNLTGGADGLSYFTSERVGIIGATWTIDDMAFDHPVTIDEIRWAGGYRPDYNYTVEVLLLNSDFTPVTGGRPSLLDPTYAIGNFDVERTFGAQFGYTAYNGRVFIPPTHLAAGRYYLGVRLVSDNGAGFGRNVIFTTGLGETRGATEAYVYAPFFGINTLTPIGSVGAEQPSDFAFQVWGVPEPTSVFLALAGLALLRRR
jgi:hypothetical protein